MAIKTLEELRGFQAPVTKKRSLVKSLLPAAGAIGAGLVAAPFTGGLSLPATLALLGGASAIGGGIGEFGAQRASGEKFDLGKIGREAGWSGVFGTAGAGVGALKGLQAAKAAGLTGKAARAAAQPVAAGTMRAKDLAGTIEGISKSGVGGSLRAWQRGIVPGLKQSSGKGLPTATTRAENAALDQVSKGFRGITKTGQFTQAEKEITKKIAAYKATPEAAKRISSSHVSEMLSGINKNIAANPSLKGNLGKTSSKTLRNIKDEIASFKGKTRGEFAEYLPKINQKAKAIVEKGQVGSKEVQIWEEVRDALKTFVDTKLPGKSEINKELTTLIGASNRLSQRITRDVGAGAGQGLTLGRLAENVAGPVAEVAGRGVQQVGRLTGGSLGRQTLRQSVPRVGMAALAPEPPVEEPLAASPMGLEQALQGLPQSQPQASMYPLEAALADIQRDPKNASKYQALYEMVKEEEGAGVGGANITKVTAQQYGLAQTGLQSLQQLSGLLQSDPSVLNRSATPGRQLPIAGGYISRAAGTGEFDAYGYNIADTLLRLRTGAQANESEIRNLQSQIMPRAGDSPTTVRTKLAQLEQAFNGVLSLAGAGGATEPGYEETPQYLMGGY